MMMAIRRGWQFMPPSEVQRLLAGKSHAKEHDTLERQGLSVGMEIVAIDGTEVHEYAIKHIQPFVFYSTKQDMEVQVYEHNLLKGHIDKPLKIRTKDNKEFSVSRRLKKLDKPVQIFESPMEGTESGEASKRRSTSSTTRRASTGLVLVWIPGYLARAFDP